MDDDDDYNKLTIKEEATDDDESKMDFTASSIDMSGVKKEQDEDDDDIPMVRQNLNSWFLLSIKWVGLYMGFLSPNIVLCGNHIHCFLGKLTLSKHSI